MYDIGWFDLIACCLFLYFAINSKKKKQKQQVAKTWPTLEFSITTVEPHLSKLSIIRTLQRLHCNINYYYNVQDGGSLVALW